MNPLDQAREHPLLAGLLCSLLLLVMAIGTFVWVSGLPRSVSIVYHKDSKAMTPQAASASGDARNEIRESATRVVDANADLSASLRSLREEFSSTDNYAAFIRSALTRSAVGGKFYAERAYDRCGSVRLHEQEFIKVSRSTPKSGNRTRDATLEELARAVDRCKDVF
ncbi:MAG: hypothetical protein ACREYF_13125, partial [Gammaproteobacteria bacterium]